MFYGATKGTRAWFEVSVATLPVLPIAGKFNLLCPSKNGNVAKQSNDLRRFICRASYCENTFVDASTTDVQFRVMNGCDFVANINLLCLMKQCELFRKRYLNNLSCLTTCCDMSNSNFIGRFC